MSTMAGVMTKFRIDELSAVDHPAQKGARAAIIKRDSGGDAGNGQDGPKEDAMSNTAIAKALGLAENADEAAILAAITKSAEGAASVAALTASVEVLKAKAGMSDKEKAHMEGKDDEAICKFMALSPEARGAEIAKAAAGDETVVIEGRTISKRAVGEDVFAVMKAQAKRIEDNEAAIAKAAEETANVAFAKRATDEFGHLAGSAEDRALVLKYLSKADDKVKAAAEAILKAAEASSKFAFSRRGAGGEGGDETSAGARLEKMAKNYAEANKVSFAKAMDAVAQTPEGARLYEESLNS